MRNSRVLREVREGKFASCIKLNMIHPVVVELAGQAGVSAVWLCNEHVPGNWTDVDHCVRAAKIHDLDVIVRVAKGSYSEYIKPFEADAAGIMVPHIESAEEALKVVETCRFLPLGKRALDGGNVDGGFCQIPMAEYIEQSNREKYLIFQIESPEAIENIEEIAAVPGYDFLLFGPGDYSHRIGDPGNISHPEVLAARAKVEEAAARHGKKLFGVGVGNSPVSELRERGYVIASVASDVHSLGTAFNAAAGKYSQVESAYASK